MSNIKLYYKFNVMGDPFIARPCLCSLVDVQYLPSIYRIYPDVVIHHKGGTNSNSDSNVNDSRPEGHHALSEAILPELRALVFRRDCSVHVRQGSLQRV